MNPDAAAKIADRLTQIGVTVRSPELVQHVRARNEFYERGGNRQMRRAAARTQRRKGR